MQWYWQKQAESSWRTDWENIVEPAAANTRDAEHGEEDNADDVEPEAGDMVFMASLRVSGRLEVMRLYPVTVKNRMEMWALTTVAEWTIPRLTRVR